MAPYNNIKESINLNNARYLLSLSQNQFKTTVWSDGDENARKSINVKDYCNLVRRYLKSQLLSNGTMEFSYKYSKNMEKFGRQWSKGFSVQSLKKNLRGFLCKGIYNDFDMRNCHPTILAYIAKTYLCKNEADYLKRFKYLNKCIIDRDNTLKQMETTKIDLITALNSDKVCQSFNIHMGKIDEEFKYIQDQMYNNTPEPFEKYALLKGQSKKNPKGSFLNSIMSIVESEIMDKVVEHFGIDNVSTVMFDGLHLPISLDIDETIETLDNISEVYGVKWSYKPADNSISIDEGIDVKDFENKSYEFVKDELEQHAFIIENPIMFGFEYELNGIQKYALHNKGDFADKIETYQFETMTQSGIKESAIFKKWMGDVTRKSYKELNFIPIHGYENNDIYNTFQGFKMHGDMTYEKKNDAILLFKELIGVLCNNELIAVDYLINYFADMFQNTATLPGVAILIKSKQGWGKDTLVDMIESMMGEMYVMRTADTEELFGSFNSGLANKIFVQLNELEGKHGFANKEKLKNFITSNKTILNEKNVKKYTQDNYARTMITTNNLAPIDIPYDDRRYVVMQAQPKKPTSAFFEKIRKVMSDKDAMKSLYEWLISIDLSDISLRNQRPLTQAYKDMRTNGIHPLFKFLHTCFIGKGFNSYFGAKSGDGWIRNGKTKTIGVKVDVFYEALMGFVQEEGEVSSDNSRFSAKLIQKLLTSVGVKTDKRQINGERSRFHFINEEEILVEMNQLNIEKEEDDSDDWN